MNHPDYIKRREALIDECVDMAIAARLNWRKHKNFTAYQRELRKGHAVTAKAIDDLVLAVIGEDESHRIITKTGEPYDSYVYRSELRTIVLGTQEGKES